MTILNPQYAFLEADYKNTNLGQGKEKEAHISSNVRQSIEPIKEEIKGFKSIVIWLLLKINPVAPILVYVPADIYCVVFLMTGELLIF